MEFLETGALLITGDTPGSPVAVRLDGTGVAP
jgi:hypothetical protein